MKDKIVVITGGNAGIGKQTALGLARKGAEVIIVSRDKMKGQATAKEIQAHTENNKVIPMHADLSSFASVRQFAEEFKSRYDHLDVLINNAGAFFTNFEKTEDGFERQWQVNHLSGFLLTHLLLDHLKKAPQGRVINVSSKGHYKGFIYFKDVNREKKYNGLAAYAQSKLANVMFTVELAERLKDTSVTANCLHPGVVKTSIGDKNNASWVGLIWKIGKLFMISEEDGAKTSIYLASSEKLNDVSGKYFDNKQVQEPNKYADDSNLREELWTLSAKQTGISG